MKFDFNSQSTYPRFWTKGGSGLLQTFLSPEVLKMNYGFWATQFRVDPNLTIRQANGTATFESKLKEIEGAGILDMRAPLGDSVARDVKGIQANMGTIPDFIAKSYHETATERDNKEKQFEEYFGDDTAILMEYAEKIQDMVNDADQTVNYMSGQLLSTGHIDYKAGDGIQDYLYDANVPKENFLKVSAVWSTPSTPILSEMVQIETDTFNRWGVKPEMKWQITKDMFVNVFLKNDEVKEWIRYTNTINNVVLPTSLEPTVDMATKALALRPGLSPIEIIETQVKNNGKMEKPWKDEIAVFRPRGFAGLVRHTTIEDKRLFEKYGASNIQRTFTKVGNSGLYLLMNTMLDNGNLKEWHTDLLVACMPSLDEFLYHIIVDTNQTKE